MKRQSNVLLILLMVVLCLVASNANANLTLDDGGTHDVDYFVSGDLNVLDGPGPTSTTVNLLSGSEVENEVLANETSRVNVYDGLIHVGLKAYDSSLVNVHGGGMYILTARDNSVVNIYDGSMFELRANETGEVNVYGGSKYNVSPEAGIINIYGGSILTGLYPFVDGRVNIYGANFNYPYGPITDISGTLTGTLFSGESVNWYFERLDSSSIYLLIPAPGALVLGSLGVGLISWLRRHRML